MFCISVKKKGFSCLSEGFSFADDELDGNDGMLHKSCLFYYLAVQFIRMDPSMCKSS